MGRRWLLLAVILSAPSGCDNVKWGGVDVRLQAPSARAVVAPAAAAEPEAETSLPELPRGPILLAGVREGGVATLAVVGEVRGDALEPLPTADQVPGFLERFTRTLFAPGAELVLFSEGVRVGRLTVTGTALDSTWCAPRPRVTGVVELAPEAMGATRLLALSDPASRSRSWEPFRSLRDEYDQRAASISLATQTIPQVGAAWPPSLVGSRASLDVFRLPEAPGPSVAATFLDRDRLAVAEPGPGAYALLVIGTAENGTYQRSFVGFKRADEGKAAPRYFAHLDWDADGDSEILLEVFGAASRWYATLGQRGGAWVQTFQDPCGAPAG